MKIGSLFSGIGGLAECRRCLYIHAMPRGAKPKKYPTDLVEKVRSLYTLGLTQCEIAAELGITQKVIWNLMRRSGLHARKAAKRNQSGETNHMWKGDDAGYKALHLRVASIRGKPSECEHCGTKDSRRFEWASRSRRYEDVFDYIRLCSSCHHKMDGHVKNLGIHAIRKEVRP